MKFNPNARLDTSQVQDRRSGGGSGSSGGGFGGIPGGKGGLAVGGGGLGLIVIVVIVLFNSFSGGSGSGSSGAGNLLQGAAGNATVDNAQLQSACRSGADASSNEDPEVAGATATISFATPSAPSGTGPASSRFARPRTPRSPTRSSSARFAATTATHCEDSTPTARWLEPGPFVS